MLLKPSFGQPSVNVGNPEIRNHPAYRDIDGPYRRVHEHGRNAVKAATAGDQERALAEAALISGVSAEVLRDLDAGGAHLSALEGAAHG